MSEPEATAGPPRGLNRLLQLQELDLSIDRLSARLTELEAEGELQRIRQQLSEAESKVGELRLSIDEVATAQRRLESDVDSMERKIEAERRRLYDGTVANARELQSIEAEVTSLRTRKARTEDAVLEQMERREELESRLGPAESQTEEARSRVAEIEEGSARELVEIEKALGERRAERETLITSVDPELLALYEDLRRAKKGLAAVALDGGVCGGCHQKLSPVYLDRLRHERGIWRCEYCRRILISA